MFKMIGTASLSLLAVTACATAPEPCTSEWVEYKTEKVLKNFAVSNYSKVRKLKNFSETLEGGNVGPLTALKIPGMIEDFKELAVSFEQRVIPEINSAVEQCGTSEELIPVFTKYLRSEGVGEDVLEWVSLLSAIALDAET